MNETNNARITRIELVNGSMLTFTLALPKDSQAEDFSEAIGDVLNCFDNEVNSFATETELKVGDEITPAGVIVSGEVAESGIEKSYLNTKKVADYRDAFAAKNH